LAYSTWGNLNDQKSNAILICHALTGDQYVTGKNPVTNRSGWWINIVGPNKILDTNKYFIICSNVLGGCMGTTGPSSINSDVNKPYGMNFPIFTIKDMVNLQLKLIDSLKIKQLFSIIGGSMGGMQVLEWAASYPDRVYSAIPIATSYRHSAQNIAFHEVARQAIMNDPEWNEGNYYHKINKPRHGLSVARMIAHITYLSEGAFQKKFGRDMQSKVLSWGFDADFQVESYLRHQGTSFVDRFDANSYLYITRAMDYFDLSSSNKGDLSIAFKNTKCKFLIISFTSDWLFPSSESNSIVKALNKTAADISYIEIESDKGHDSFLLKVNDFYNILSGFISGAARKLNIQ
jgi:homoserine O-acetyltransferase/O-succinyltransferase